MEGESLIAFLTIYDAAGKSVKVQWSAEIQQAGDERLRRLKQKQERQQKRKK